MKQELSIDVKLHVDVSKDIDTMDITRHIRRMIPELLDKRVELVEINKVTVLPYEKPTEKEIIPDVIELIESINNNTWELWKPDFSDTVKAVILNDTDIRECDEDGAAVYNFKGINLIKAIIEEKLRLEKDYGL